MTDLDDTDEFLERVKHLIRLFEDWTLTLKETGGSGHLDLNQLLIRLDGINKEMRTAALSMARIAGRDGTFGQIREEMAAMRAQMDRQEEMTRDMLAATQTMMHALALPLPGQGES